MKPFTSVIIAAAGKSRRMTSTKDKLFAPLCGKFVIERTVSAFINAKTVDEIIIVTSEENMENMHLLLSPEHPKKVAAIVQGGATRAESVKNGVAAVSKECEFISIHDGARPFITPEEIDRLHTLAYEKGALCCGAPVTDTIKTFSGSKIGKTVDRSSLFAAQTPQIFKKEIYLDALEKVGDKIDSFTDDSSIVEAAGYTVYGEYTSLFNIKITTEADLLTGRAIINTTENKRTL